MSNATLALKTSPNDSSGQDLVIAGSPEDIERQFKELKAQNQKQTKLVSELRRQAQEFQAEGKKLRQVQR